MHACSVMLHRLSSAHFILQQANYFRIPVCLSVCDDNHSTGLMSCPGWIPCIDTRTYVHSSTLSKTNASNNPIVLCVRYVRSKHAAPSRHSSCLPGREKMGASQNHEMKSWNLILKCRINYTVYIHAYRQLAGQREREISGLFLRTDHRYILYDR